MKLSFFDTWSADHLLTPVQCSLHWLKLLECVLHHSWSASQLLIPILCPCQDVTAELVHVDCITVDLLHNCWFQFFVHVKTSRQSWSTSILEDTGGPGSRVPPVNSRHSRGRPGSPFMCQQESQLTKMAVNLMSTGCLVALLHQWFQ